MPGWVTTKMEQAVVVRYFQQSKMGFEYNKLQIEMFVNLNKLDYGKNCDDLCFLRYLYKG